MAKQENTTKAEDKTPAVDTTPEEPAAATPETSSPGKPAPAVLATVKITAERLTVGQLMYGRGARATIPAEIAKRIEADGKGEIIGYVTNKAEEPAADSSIPHYDL